MTFYQNRKKELRGIEHVLTREKEKLRKNRIKSLIPGIAGLMYREGEELGWLSSYKHEN